MPRPEHGEQDFLAELERELSHGAQRNTLVAAYDAVRVGHDKNEREQLRRQWEEGSW